MSSELKPIAIMTCDPHGTSLPVRVLLADLADSVAAYDRQAARLLGEPHRPRRITWMGPDAPVTAPLVVVGIEADKPIDLTGFSLPKDSLVYGVCVAGAQADGDGKTSCEPLDELAATCERDGARWAGGLMADYGHLNPERNPKLPRMGMLRRPISEATDRLVACLRSDLSVWQAAELFDYEGKLAKQAGCGLIEARQPLPAAVCRLLEALS